MERLRETNERMRGLNGEMTSPFARLGGWISRQGNRRNLPEERRYDAPTSEAPVPDTVALVPPAQIANISSSVESEASKGPTSSVGVTSKKSASTGTRISRDPDGIHSDGIQSIDLHAREMMRQMELAKANLFPPEPHSCPPVSESVTTPLPDEIPLALEKVQTAIDNAMPIEPSEVSSDNPSGSDRPNCPVYEVFEPITGLVGGLPCTFCPNIEGFDHPFRRGWIGEDQANRGSRYRYYVVKQGYHPGIYLSYPAAWVRIADFQRATRSRTNPKGLSPVIKGFNQYTAAVAFLGWDPDEEPNPHPSYHKPRPRLPEFAEGCGPDPYLWCGECDESLGLEPDDRSIASNATDSVIIPDVMPSSSILSADSQSVISGAQAIREVTEAFLKVIDTRDKVSDSHGEEKHHRAFLSKTTGKSLPQLVRDPDREALTNWQLLMNATLQNQPWRVDGEVILSMEDGPDNSPKFRLRSQTLCRLLVERLGEHHGETLDRFPSEIANNYGVALYHAICDHLDPNSQSSIMADFKAYFSPVQRNGETIHSLSRDLSATRKRLVAASFDINDCVATLNIVRAVLEGAYAGTEAIKPIAIKIVHEDLDLATISYDQWVTQVLNAMTNAELHVNGVASKLPSSAIARRMQGGSIADAWFGQKDLDRMSIQGVFKITKCPICRISRSNNDHYLNECPIAKEFGYTITYDPEKDNRRTRRDNKPTDGTSRNRHVTSKSEPSEDSSTDATESTIASDESVRIAQEKMVTAQREFELVRRGKAPSSKSQRNIARRTYTSNRFQPFVDAHNIKESDSDEYIHDFYDRIQGHTAQLSNGSMGRCVGVCRHVNSKAKSQHPPDTMVADSGATSDMFKEKRHFGSDYKPCKDIFVYMGDGSPVPIHGIGTATIKVNGRVIELQNAFHVPDLECGLLSVTRHGLRGPGCAYLVENGHMHISFPGFALSMPIPPNGDPRFVLDEMTPEDYLKCDYSSRGTIKGLDTVKGRTAFLHLLHRGRLMTRAQARKRGINILKETKEVIKALTSPIGSRIEESANDSFAKSERGLSEATLRDDPNQLMRNSSSQYCVESAKGSSPSKYTRAELERHFGGRQLDDYRVLSEIGDGIKVLGNRNDILSVGRLVNRRRGRRRRRATRATEPLSVVGMDIAYGPSASPGGTKFMLILVDQCTTYTWAYGMQGTSGADISEALWKFFVDAGGFPANIRCDFDRRFLGGAAMTLLRSHGCHVTASPPNRQSQNGLVERRWQILEGMARAFLTEARLPTKFWYWAVREAVHRLNILPITSNPSNPKDLSSLTTPFEALHGKRPDYRILFPFGCLGSFRRYRDHNQDRGKFHSQGLLGIALGRSEYTNGMIFYNPTIDSFSVSADYILDTNRTLGEVFPSISYDGGLITSIISTSRKDTPTKFVNGDSVFILDDTNDVKPGQIITPPTSISKYYTVKLEDETTISCRPDQVFTSETLPSTGTPTTTLGFFTPSWMKIHSKVTLLVNDVYTQGYLNMDKQGFWEFVTRTKSGEITSTAPLPDLPYSWKTRLLENNLSIGWDDTKAMRMYGYGRHVSAATLINPMAPASLARGLSPSNPDAPVWRLSYDEEYDGLSGFEAFEEITEEEYQRLLKKYGDSIKAIPTMSLFTIKKDKDGNPVRAKTRIVVLGNLERRIWEKIDRYAPVINAASNRLLISMAVEAGRVLKQGDCKNAFCQPQLPDDEITIVQPPKGCPRSTPGSYWRLKKTLYGLSRSPRHWYKTFSGILVDLGFKSMVQDPCLFKCRPFPDKPPIYLGMYVDDFVYFSESDEVEQWLEQELAAKLTVDFMGTVSWFLGCSYDWHRTKEGKLICHVSQQAFVEQLLDKFGMEESYPVDRPLRSGLPIDRIDRDSTPKEDKLEFIRSYQSLMGGLTWLVISTRPDINVATKLLSQFNSNPSKGHMEAAKYVLRYLKDTSSHGIWFRQDEDRLHSSMSFPDEVNSRDLIAFTDACWGPQDASKPKENDTRIARMDEMNSLQGYYITRMGGAISWGVHREKRISGSSCEAEIKAMDDGTKALQFIRHLVKQIGLPDADVPTPLLNDNRGSVDWTNNGGVVSKKLRHANISEFRVLEAAKHGEIKVYWIPGKDNPADLFSKEHKDIQMYKKLRDHMVCARESIYNEEFPDRIKSKGNTAEKTVEISTEPTAKKVTFNASENEVITFGIGNKYPPIECTIPNWENKDSSSLKDMLEACEN